MTFLKFIVYNLSSINQTHISATYIFVNSVAIEVPADHLCIGKVVVILKVKDILTDIW